MIQLMQNKRECNPQERIPVVNESKKLLGTMSYKDLFYVLKTIHSEIQEIRKKLISNRNVEHLRNKIKELKKAYPYIREDKVLDNFESDFQGIHENFQFLLDEQFNLNNKIFSNEEKEMNWKHSFQDTFRETQINFVRGSERQNQWIEMKIDQQEQDQEYYELFFGHIRNDQKTLFFHPYPYILLVNENTCMVRIHYFFMKLDI